MATVTDMTKQQLIKALVAKHAGADNGEWGRFYGRWTTEQLRRQLTLVTAYQAQSATLLPIFDPDEGLRKLREGVDVADTFAALDHWLSNGGSLPRAWMH